MPWFVQSQGDVFGPYDEPQFKKLATEGRISPTTQVSQSREGPWAAASRVKGLFPSNQTAKASPMLAAVADQPSSGATSAAVLNMHAQAVEQLETISNVLTQIVSRVQSNGNGSASSHSGIMQYKVLTQKDKWFSGKFDPEKLEGAINSYAAQGWRVCGVATASFPGFGGNRDEMVVVMERDS
jgi:Domain of unknown function (DUF4177)/GYF domain 2